MIVLFLAFGGTSLQCFMVAIPIFVTDGVEAFHFLHILTSTCQLPTTKQKENKFQWGEPEAVQPPSAHGRQQGGQSVNQAAFPQVNHRITI